MEVAAAVAAVNGEVAILRLHRRSRPHIVHGGRLSDHVVKGRRGIEAGCAEGVIVGEDGLGRVSDHDVVVAVGKPPGRQQIVLGVVIEQRLGLITRLLRREQGGELRLAVIGIPARVVGVLGVPGRHGMNRLVKADILAVRVAPDVWMQQHPVEHGVEELLLRRRPAANLNPREQSVPGRMARGADRVEVPIRIVGLPVELRVADAHEGNADLGLQDLVGRGVEGQEYRIGSGLARLGDHLRGRERVVEGNVEMDRVGIGRAAEVPAGGGPLNLVMADDLRAACHRSVLAVEQLHEDVGIGRRRKGKAAHGAPPRRCQFGGDRGAAHSD